ncbi:MAG: hypothetical protein LBH22_06360 [Bacteroidales bacterium]|jgi:hypothetical protein|nr:hypothetical protein [Bacteroidales bacterium]
MSFVKVKTSENQINNNFSRNILSNFRSIFLFFIIFAKNNLGMKDLYIDYAITKKLLAISKKDLKTSDIQKIRDTLIIINQMCSGQFYMIDYFQMKLIIDSPKFFNFCEYTKEQVEEEGVTFLNKIVNEETLKRGIKMTEAASKIFFRYPPHQRTKMTLICDHTIITAKGRELPVHHRIVPYKLCNDGNVWLGLCHIIVSPTVKPSGQAVILNTETGEKYEYINGGFELFDAKLITETDIRILEWLVKDVPDKQMHLLYNEFFGDICLNTFKSRKQRLLEKLNVNSTAGAVHKAHLMGII